MQKDDSKGQAGTSDDSGQNDEITSVSQHSRKPPVVGSQMSSELHGNVNNKEFVYKWFYEQMKSLIKSTELALNSSPDAIVYLGSIKLFDESAIPVSETKVA